MEAFEMKQLFEKAYEDHADTVFRHIFFRISDRERAKELTQDVFMRYWQYLSSDKEVENIKAFLLTSARNAVINEYRARKNDVSLDEMMEVVGDKIEDMSLPSLTTRLIAKDLMASLDELPDHYKDVLVYKYVEGLSIKEISKETGESESNISVRIHRAAKKLKDIIEAKEKEL